MQAAGDFVGVVIEFAARVQDGHDDFGSAAPFFGVDIDRDAAAVVAHGDGFVLVDDDVDFGAVTGKGFVDGVIDDFKDHVMQAAAVVGIADVHAGADAYCFQSFEYANAGGVVGVIVAHGSLWVLV